jgi:alkylation response protein AidB-like acyl-CoA dehydrogenase
MGSADKDQRHGSEDSNADFVAAARALAPLIRDHADESERERRLAKPVVEAFAAAGLYRVAAPASVGGYETDPFVQIETIEAAAYADGASGWNLMIGIENMGFLGAALKREVATELFSDPGLLVSGALNPLGRAVAEPGGLRVNGRWPFASGCQNSQYFWGQCILNAGTEQATLREVVLPIDSIEIIDTWSVSGLRGTGSHDVRAVDVFVPDEMTTGVLAGDGLQEDGPLFRMHPAARLAYNKVGVATGIARAAIDHFVTLASEKTPRFSAKPLRERPMAQLALAEAETTLRSARAWVFEAVGTVWEAALAGRTASLEERALLQLSCSHAASAAVQSVERIHAMTGVSANFTSSPLERCWRDVQVVRQHIMVSPQWSEAAGRVLLGLDSGSPIL